MFTDIEAKLRDPYCQRTFGRLNFHELLYADDTMLIAKGTMMAKKILHLIEEDSEYYSLALNGGKCNHISFNHNANIHFKKCEEMKWVTEAIYLGSNITKNVDLRSKHKTR